MPRLLLLPAVVMMTAGLLSAGHGPAAATSPWQTTCAGYLVGQPDQHVRAHIRADVDAPSTTGQPRGFIHVSVRKFNGGDGDTGRFFTRGGHVDLHFGPLKPGRYSGHVYFEPRGPAPGPPVGPGPGFFASCSDTFLFNVRRASA